MTIRERQDIVSHVDNCIEDACKKFMEDIEKYCSSREDLEHEIFIFDILFITRRLTQIILSTMYKKRGLFNNENNN